VDEKVQNTARVLGMIVSMLLMMPEGSKRTPYSLSYHEINFMKFWFKDIPALASKMLECVSPFISLETTSSSV